MTLCVDPTSLSPMGDKRLAAITGDPVELRHPTLALDRPASTFISVRWNDRPYHIISKPPQALLDTTMTTGEYSLNGHLVRVRERVDQLEMGAAGVVYENTLHCPNGFLQVETRGWHGEGLELFEQLSPSDTPLGVTVTLGQGLRLLAAPQLLLEVERLGVLSVKPLTPDLASVLPDWQGTPVAGGELFAANLTRTEPYLLLVGKTAVTSILLPEAADLDDRTALAAQLHVEWTTP